MNDDKLKITLRIADLKTPLALRVDYGADEKYWRDAADLFNKRWAFYKDKYKDGLMDSESMMAMVAVEMARLYCEMVQDRKTLLADLRKLEAEAAKILDGHTGENGTEKRDNSCTATGPSKGQVGSAFFITII